MPRNAKYPREFIQIEFFLPEIRLGIYNILLEKFSKDGQTPGFFAKAGMGLTAGAIGAFCGTPADVALVRMCVDNRLPEAERRNYKRERF